MMTDVFKDYLTEDDKGKWIVGFDTAHRLETQ
jgi:hypothetical protein